jgi:hypothetical protein
MPNPSRALELKARGKSKVTRRREAVAEKLAHEDIVQKMTSSQVRSSERCFSSVAKPLNARRCAVLVIQDYLYRLREKVQ